MAERGGFNLQKGKRVRIGDLKKRDTFKNKGNHYIVCHEGDKVMTCFCLELLKFQKFTVDQIGTLVTIDAKIETIYENVN